MPADRSTPAMEPWSNRVWIVPVSEWLAGSAPRVSICRSTPTVPSPSSRLSIPNVAASALIATPVASPRTASAPEPVSCVSSARLERTRTSPPNVAGTRRVSSMARSRSTSRRCDCDTACALPVTGTCSKPLGKPGSAALISPCSAVRLTDASVGLISSGEISKTFATVGPRL